MKRQSVLWFVSAAATLLVLFSGCSSGSSSAPGSNAADQLSDQSTAPSMAEAPGMAAAGSTEKTAAKAVAKSQAGLVNAAEARKIVKSASLTIETMQYEQSTGKLESLVKSFGGYIENSSVQGTGVRSSGSGRTASYTARIPADQLDPFLNAAPQVGNVIGKNVKGEDVTQTYVDSAARLKALQTERDRILELMKKADKVEDLLSIEDRLTQVQSEIEQITARLKTLDTQISLSSVSVTVREVGSLSVPAGQSLGGQITTVFGASVHALGETFRYLMIGVIAVLPFAAVAAVIVVIVLAIRKRRKKK